MVRTIRMITGHCEILASFVHEAQLPFHNTKLDLFLSIAPHQTRFPLETRRNRKLGGVGCEEINVSCVCRKTDPQSPSSIDRVISSADRQQNSLLWLDPTRIATECLSLIFAKWLSSTRSTSNTGLGVIVPLHSGTLTNRDGFKAWAVTSSGLLKKEFKDNDLPVWYPSLERKPEFLEEIVSAVRPFDVFPIVEFPRIIDHEGERYTSSHRRLLDSYRTRTRNFIYLNSQSPEEALGTLYETFSAVPRTGRMPRSVIITPGGQPISYLVTLLAGILAEGTFITPEMETLCPEETQGTWGFAIFKKRE